jgi:hypothetical protein
MLAGNAFGASVCVLAIWLVSLMVEARLVVAYPSFVCGAVFDRFRRCMVLAIARRGGLGFVRNGREFAHVHGNGLLDVKLTSARAAELVSLRRAEPHHVFGPSAWISVWLKTPADCKPALALLAEAGALCRR